MKYIGFAREEEALVWAQQALGMSREVGFCRALSAVDEYASFVFVVVLSNFTPRNVDMHTAAVPGATWASPRAAVRMFNGIFGCVFDELAAARVTGLVRAKNASARRFDEHLGFKLEGIMRKSFEDDDLCIYGFLKEDYLNHKWYRTPIC